MPEHPPWLEKPPAPWTSHLIGDPKHREFTMKRTWRRNGLHAYLLSSLKVMLSGKSLSKEQVPQTALLCGSFRVSRKERQTSCSWHLSRRLTSKNLSTLLITSFGRAGVSGTPASIELLMRSYTCWIAAGTNRDANRKSAPRQSNAEQFVG